MNPDNLFFKLVSKLFLLLGIVALTASGIAVCAISWKVIRWAFGL